MADITLAPTDQPLQGVAGNPFALILNYALTGPSGSLPASDLTAPVASVVYRGAELTGMEPTITVLGPGQLGASWTAEQTMTLGTYDILRWGLSATIAGSGPIALLAGRLVMTPATEPGDATTTTVDLTVSVGTVTADITVQVAAVITGTLPTTGTAGAPTAGDWPTDAVALDSTGRLWVRTEGGDPGMWKLPTEGLTGALLAANDLSDLSSAPTARTNLGLGSAATHAATDFDAAGAAAAAEAGAIAASDPVGAAATAQATAESFAATAVGTETTRATTAESELDTDLTEEVTRATEAEGTNATAITTETTRAETAEVLAVNRSAAFTLIGV